MAKKSLEVVQLDQEENNVAAELLLDALEMVRKGEVYNFSLVYQTAAGTEMAFSKSNPMKKMEHANFLQVQAMHEILQIEED